MNIQMVTEEFNVFLNENITLYDAIDNDYEMPFVRVRFYVRSPYFSQDPKGQLQLARNERRQFHQLINEFLTPYQEYFDTGYGSDEGLIPLDKMHTFVQGLATQIKLHFEEKDQIELYDIQVLGIWDAFHGKHDSPLMLEAKNQ